MTRKDYDMSVLLMVALGFGVVSVLLFPSNFSFLLRSIELKREEGVSSQRISHYIHEVIDDVLMTFDTDLTISQILI